MSNQISSDALTARINELVRVLNSEIDTAVNQHGLKVDLDIFRVRDIREPNPTPLLLVEVHSNG